MYEKKSNVLPNEKLKLQAGIDNFYQWLKMECI